LEMKNHLFFIVIDVLEQKAVIQSRLRDRAAIRNIAAELQISKSTVILCKKKIGEYGEIKRENRSYQNTKIM